MSPHVHAERQAHGATKSRAATLSIVSNTLLILLKVVAGAITGSIAILTEAIHSAFDLIASVVAYVSIRKANEPADDDHRYGHAKAENVAAAIEGMLVLVGSAVIIFEATRRLFDPGPLEQLGVGIAVIGFSTVVNFAISTYLFRRAEETDSPALEGDATHLRTDAFTSLGVLFGLVAVETTGAEWIDPAAALAIAVLIIFTGLKLLKRSSAVLMDEALPAAELTVIEEEIRAFREVGVCGFHQLRTRRAGSARYIDMHVQFVSGTSLEEAHRQAHRLQDAIEARVRGADILIHIEPQDRVRPGTEI